MLRFSYNRSMASYPLLLSRLTICGVAELDHHCGAEVTHALSIMDPWTPDPVAFGRFGPHRRSVLRFHDHVDERSGGDAPQEHHVEAILEFGGEFAATPPGHLLVHCWMGMSRSTAAAAIILAQHNPGQEAAAFDRVFAVRPRSWPNARMIGFADRLLQRRGALLSALKDHHRRVLGKHPEIAEVLRGYGRSARPGE